LPIAGVDAFLLLWGVIRWRTFRLTEEAAPMSADRNLLFGMLALHNGFVTREQLLEGMHAWMLHRDRSLGDLLYQQGVLAEDDHRLIDSLVSRQIRQHGDAQKSLAALPLDAQARQQLQRLPDADVQASLAALPDGDFPVTVMTAPPVASLRFRRLRPHARGGLGEVYVALDEELHREVALKEIQDRFADHPDSRARFVREAEVTGNLEHPGVVPIHGLGCYPDGRPYYAMRFIRGEPMHDAIARFHAADANARRDPGERSLALRELLSRFVAVCNAIAYAHARGIVHRDLKPANIMLGEYGETIVVDWGLARVLDRPDGEQTTAERPVILGPGSGSAPTEMGQVVGTPAYMPPEQAEGRLDRVGIASDVFALGATLYCVLTGQPPYCGDDVLAQARRAEVTPARQRKAVVPRALEAVCAKAMAARPEQRYATARSLAQEVQRWLADEPVEAYREKGSDRARRWGRRHRSVVSGAVVLLLSCVVGLSVGLWAVRLEQAKTKAALDEAEMNLERALEAEATATKHLKQAEANLKLAKKAVDDCYNVVEKDPLFQGPRMEKARKLLLQMTLPFYKQFRSWKPDDLRLQREEAGQIARVGYIANVLGHHSEALEAYQQARLLRTQLVKAHPDVPQYQQDLAATHKQALPPAARKSKGLQETPPWATAASPERVCRAHAPASPAHSPALA
jgi:serine/threonine-protein kinase